MCKQVCILDYGSGNVKSVYNMVRMITDEVVISNETDDIQAATHLILPGVGAFSAAMEKIHRHLPLTLLEELVVTGDKPFLGICVGMQVLADEGHEFGFARGLGWIPGQTGQLTTPLRLPHIGWNNVKFDHNEPISTNLADEEDFYFVHSFAFYPTERSYQIASTYYGGQFCSAVRLNNIVGVQFHPEKSQQAGKQLLSNFLSM